MIQDNGNATVVVDNNDDTSTTLPQTNPRVRAIDELIALLKADEEQYATDSVVAYITSLMDRLETLKAPRRKGRKSIDGSKKSPHVHFVLVRADGTREYLRSDRIPTKDTCVGAVSCLGFFNTKAGAEWVVANGARETDPQVF